MRPDSAWTPSPNFRPSPPRKISAVILHATATSGLQSPKDWLCSPDSKVSAHYLVDLDGTIYHLVHEQNVAWHAGVSTWKGQDDVNEFSVGIEMVNANDGQMAYPVAQVAAVLALVTQICKDNQIAPEDVVGHLDIAPGRKTDPAGFDFGDFRVSLAAALKA